MSRVLIGIISGVGGLIIGGFGGRKTSNITMKDVKAAPGKAGSAILGAVKKTGQKIGSGLSSLAFWKKKKEMKKGKVNFEQKFQDLTVKHSKLSDDFSETAKRMSLVEIERDDEKELLRQANETIATFQTTVDDKDTELTQAATDLKQANTDKQKAITDKQKVSTDLQVAQATIKEMAKTAPEN